MLTAFGPNDFITRFFLVLLLVVFFIERIDTIKRVFYASRVYPCRCLRACVYEWRIIVEPFASFRNICDVNRRHTLNVEIRLGKMCLPQKYTISILLEPTRHPFVWRGDEQNNNFAGRLLRFRFKIRAFNSYPFASVWWTYGIPSVWWMYGICGSVLGTYGRRKSSIWSYGRRKSCTWM